MDQGRANDILDVMSGRQSLTIAFEPRDIAMLAGGVFLAMLLALVVAKHL